jgi:hypothetical protein
MSVTVRVGQDGSVCSLDVLDSTMPADMVDCVLAVFKSASYPAPDGGCINATVPMAFKPQVPQSGP